MMTISSHPFTTLRRADREIADPTVIEAILRRAGVGRLGLAVDNTPYVVPLNYVYHSGAIYFHSADEGRKISMLKANPQVCFEVDEHYGTVCQFLDTETRNCTIYHARPRICRDFPGTRRCGYYDFMLFERRLLEDKDYISTTWNN